jgi:hypothetical protein
MGLRVRREREHNRWLLFLGVSALLHVAVIGALRKAPPQEQPLASTTPIELVWLSADEVPAQPSSPPSRAPPKSPSRSPSKRTAPATPSSGTGASAAAAEQPTSGGVGVAGGPMSDRPSAEGDPLTPGLGYVMHLPRALDAEPSHGATLRNHPTERVDEAAVAEYTSEVLSRTLDEQLRADVGAAAAGVGSAPPHFRRLESSLRQTFAQKPVDRTPGGDGASVAQALLTPGISAEGARRMTDTGLGRSVQNNVGGGPNLEDQRSREAMLQMMGAIEGVKERLSAARLRTVLELTTDPSGAIADVTIIEKSGDPRFDESVLHLTRKTARALPEDDDARGLGASWWRTRWQYTWEPPAVRVKLLDAVRLGPRGG